MRGKYWEKTNSSYQDQGSANIPVLLKGLSSWRYIVVVKVTSGKDPQVQAHTVEFGAGQSSFTPGTISGEAFVFDLETGQCIGGVAFSARNSDTHNFYALPSTSAEQKMEMMRQILIADLGTQAQKSIAAGIIKAAPAKKLIFKDNAANPDGR